MDYYKDIEDTSDVRDCGSCVHYKLYKDNDLYACEKWKCEYEKKEG